MNSPQAKAFNFDLDPALDPELTLEPDFALDPAIDPAFDLDPAIDPAIDLDPAFDFDPAFVLIFILTLNSHDIVAEAIS